MYVCMCVCVCLCVCVSVCVSVCLCVCRKEGRKEGWMDGWRIIPSLMPGVFVSRTAFKQGTYPNFKARGFLLKFGGF